ncbi:N-acetylglucosamine kinase [Paenibacillus thermotolerans]|uniref:N-acetylglucosamine kinase n=1 Tax=Paenibacillus thermotolerans TaxID=3027807 RepID=UPI0023677CDC|nr:MULTISPECIES: BadF/BadG/BcrA/BcrD ATPase family protein [unclassified Paenibacillus]
MEFVAGLDGGGTKTAVSIADESGRVVHTFTSGAINYNGNDGDGIRQSFRHIFETISQVAGGLPLCKHVCIAAAGISNPEVPARLASDARASGYEGGLTIVGDHEAALYGATEKPYGMIVIAGTGSICYGKNAGGSSHRTGGFGHLLDDEGSGYSIGRDMLSAVLRASDGRLPETALTGMVFERLGISSVREIVGFVYDKQTNKKDVAAIAPLLYDACALGDAAALAVAARSASSLFELVEPVAEKLSLQEGELAMAGSVLLRNSFVRDMFTSLVEKRYPGMDCFPAKQDASVGAVQMALEHIK